MNTDKKLQSNRRRKDRKMGDGKQEDRKIISPHMLLSSIFLSLDLSVFICVHLWLFPA
jgi:hypothetical protein